MRQCPPFTSSLFMPNRQDGNMSANRINATQLAARVRHQVAAGVQARKAKSVRAHGLAVIPVGNEPASHLYVSNKHKVRDKAGILSLSYDQPEDTSQAALEALI